MSVESSFDGNAKAQIRGRKRFPAVAWLVRKEGPARMVGSVLVHMEQAGDRYEKSTRLIKMAISANKVIRYRDLYGKKD